MIEMSYYCHSDGSSGVPGGPFGKMALHEVGERGIMHSEAYSSHCESVGVQKVEISRASSIWQGGGRADTELPGL